VSRSPPLRPSGQPRLRLNDVLMPWEPVRGPLSLGAAVARPGEATLVVGDSPDAFLVAAAVSLSGGYPFLWREDVPVSLASYASSLFKFSSTVVVGEGYADVLMGGRAPPYSFFRELPTPDLSSPRWDRVGEWGQFALPVKPYADAVVSQLAGLDLKGKSVRLFLRESPGSDAEGGDGDEYKTGSGREPQAEAGVRTELGKGGGKREEKVTRPVLEVLSRLGASAVAVSGETANLEGLVLEGQRPSLYVSGRRLTPWEALIAVAGSLKGPVVIPLDAPVGLDEELEKRGLSVVRHGINANDLSSDLGLSFQVGVSSAGDWVFPAVHGWKETSGGAALLVASTGSAEEALAFAPSGEAGWRLPRYEVRVTAGPGALGSLGLDLVSGFGWKAAMGWSGGCRVLAVQNDWEGATRLIVEGRDSATVKDQLEKFKEKLRAAGGAEKG